MALLKEKVTQIHHWTDKTFSFKTTRDKGFRFKNGEFAMIGLEIEGKPLLRAYSVVSPNHEYHLEPKQQHASTVVCDCDLCSATCSLCTNSIHRIGNKTIFIVEIRLLVLRLDTNDHIRPATLSRT